ncbi:MAG: ribose-phosphate pyrophosphokinase [bacterium]|jgi:ribose-phosphate pyrophosphokinase
MKIFAGRANRALAEEMAQFLETELGDCEITQFSDGEIFVKINENVRGVDVFIVQPTFPPAENLLELLIMIDAASRASASRITAVLPYYGYARQDRKDQPRVAISAKLVANLITVAGANRVLTVDLHAGQIQGFFDIPLDHLFASPVIIDYFKGLEIKDLTVVSPDMGSVQMARAVAKRLEAPLALVDKRRPKPNVSEVMNVIGEVEGRNLIILDDLVDTGGTIVEAAAALRAKGAKEIYVGCTHGILSGNALERIQKSPITELVITNTVPLADGKKADKVRILSVAPLLGEAIRRIHNGESVSSLFN